ncbi:unnamed protein product [Phytomonas sp. Hart1]|nr:unnamed protein product [Phytomonas sp. Hart1]|eukprot:CCW69089.1 unnamed protein product [Phytomonas sp. isolate Hart1]
MQVLNNVLNIGSLTGEMATENNSVCPSLSFKARVIGFIIFINFISVFSIICCVAIFVGDFPIFAIFFTLNSICGIGSTLFLAGPVYQFKNMFNRNRWIATIVYLLAMLLTFIVAIETKSGILVLLFLLIQHLTMWWYFLSYIPYAREAVRAGVSTIIL